ncbi:MAG: hypothetical protein A2541_02070 [Candidatus Taylorbacteria bacterium RIFOXYD2_FULL_36_9]|uniref:Uncharacterized protein n=1 Tax=Candidatus Taylorbacteria bacterium RIFOXYD2_FULL_36_9 TaxID=1802338 RepID=A0A1G2PHA6_9BACT|nr:MAG: hypothetical protein A2541_02070 [Candidatus Taylorbacteria bacterium RIFOXYD2_FULL_36_9]
MKDFQPQQKILNFLDDYIKSDYFQTKVLELRAEIGMPPEGFVISDDDLEKIIKSKMSFFNTVDSNKVSRENQKKVRLALRKIRANFPVDNIDVGLAFELYFYYNKCLKKMFEEAVLLDNLCKLVPARSEFFEYSADVKDFWNMYIDHQNDLTQKYPLALYISSSATQRDVVEYVRKIWNLFTEYGKEYANTTKVGKVKRKDDFIKERNELIWANRSLSRRKIMELLTDTYGADKTEDVGYIGKIISMERKRRKDV